MKYSILHISDIHKSPQVDYDSLIQSLKHDFDTYTIVENIVAPSFIVVSGDLIQGAYTEDEIRSQYDSVKEFLNGISEIFLNGNKERLIIVPGNHDVNRVASKLSLRPTSTNNDNYKENFFNGSSNIRWNWKDYKFYEIGDTDIYNKRFDLFIEFYNEFYKGLREYPVDPENQAYIYKSDKEQVCFACFNSCNHLDHLCDTGNISQDALVSIGNDLNESYNAGYLNIGVWHHNIYGRPLETNYMDRSFLNDLLFYDVKIGLFGHQHFSQIAEEYSDLLSNEETSTPRLLLVSSGTLFGGNRELPNGFRRQYNIIEIDKHNGYADVDINVREDSNQNPYSKIPHWQLKPLQNTTNKIHYRIQLKQLSTNDILLQIDKKCLNNHDYEAACESIKDLEQETGRHFDKLFKHYLKEVKDYEYVLNNMRDISTPEDAILQIVAAKELREPQWINKILEDKRFTEFGDPSVQYFLSTLKLKR